MGLAETAPNGDLNVSEFGTRLPGAGGFIDIAPGVDLQTQILDQMEFLPKIDKNLKRMDERIFNEEQMGLCNRT